MQEKEEAEQSSSSYWSIKNVLSWSGKSNTNTLSKEESSTMPSSSKPQSYEADRYPHDLNQAKAIQKGGDKFTKKDILLGLDGLDQAEQLRQSGDLKQALKVSEMAMELLIDYKSTSPCRTHRGRRNETTTTRRWKDESNLIQKEIYQTQIQTAL